MRVCVTPAKKKVWWERQDGDALIGRGMSQDDGLLPPPAA